MREIFCAFGTRKCSRQEVTTMKKIVLIGSTGSIGCQSLEVCRAHNIDVEAVAACSNIDLLEKQAREFKCKYACVYNAELCDTLKERLSDTDVTVLSGMKGLCELAALDVDLFVNAVVGMVGLLPTLTAIRNGIDIALANKETLVAGGEIVIREAKEKGVNIYPIDSEHSAIFQCLRGNDRLSLRKIILTASGGPFFGYSRKQLENVTLADALNHPNWSMGRKITVDSATMMNKGLEFIEAKWLFGLAPEQIEIIIHRQSVVHSAVEYDDYSVIAQLGVPDMKIPIQYALLYPQRLECPTRELSLTDYGKLTFEEPDFETFDCLRTTVEACKKGGAFPCYANSANEEATAAFLAERISFSQIGEIVSETCAKLPVANINCYEDVMSADSAAREFVRNKLNLN